MKHWMRMSALYAPTLKEDPAEAVLASHRLLLRAGMIRKTAAGLYSYLPLAWRSLLKIEAIIRDEMDGIGAQEILVPIMTPAELWEESGRWDVYGDELMRMHDRHDRQARPAPGGLAAADRRPRSGRGHRRADTRRGRAPSARRPGAAGLRGAARPGRALPRRHGQ